MRIRKQQPRGSAGLGEANPRPGSQEQELVQSSRRVKEKPGDDEAEMLNTTPAAELKTVELGKASRDASREASQEASVPPVGLERVGSTTRSAFTWLDKLRHSKGITETEPYSNLEDFIASLSKDGGSSLSKGRTVTSHEEVVEESVQVQLARYKSVCSELSFKQASGVGPDYGALSPSPALVSCDNESSMSASLARGRQQQQQLRSDASLPSAFRQNCSVAEPVHQGPRPDMESSKGISRGYAGTSSEKPMQYEIHKSGTVEGQPCTDVSLSQLATVEEAVLNNKQGHGTSIAEPAETRLGTLPQNDQIQGPSTETAQRRSHRNRRIPSFTDAETRHHRHPHATTAAAAAATAMVAMAKNNPPSALLLPDHPALQPKDSLVFSVDTVCQRAGKAGLTAREAMSNIMQLGLLGLEEGEVQSSRRIAKLLRRSPYYMELGEGKFALCSAVIDAEQNVVTAGEGSQPEPAPAPAPETLNVVRRSELNDSSSEPDNYNKAPAVRPKRRQREVRPIGSAAREEVNTEATKSKPGRSGRPKKLKYMKQENAEQLGNQCNRTDGKGWVCPLLAKPGYQLCDHHLDKLRCKPGSRSKKKKTTMTTTSTKSPPPPPAQVPHLDTAGHEYHTTL